MNFNIADYWLHEWFLQYSRMDKVSFIIILLSPSQVSPAGVLNLNIKAIKEFKLF